MQAYSGKIKSIELAIKEFDIVVSEYEKENNHRIQDLAAEAHARLGLAYLLTGHNEEAVEEYRLAAVTLSGNSKRAAYYEQRAKQLLTINQITN